MESTANCTANILSCLAAKIGGGTVEAGWAALDTASNEVGWASGSKAASGKERACHNTCGHSGHVFEQFTSRGWPGEGTRQFIKGIG